MKALGAVATPHPLLALKNPYKKKQFVVEADKASSLNSINETTRVFRNNLVAIAFSRCSLALVYDESSSANLEILARLRRAV